MISRPDCFVEYPQHDETFYSLVSRYHILSGNPRAVMTISELFGDQGRRLSLDPLGFKLSEFTMRAPPESPLADLHYLAMQHTSIPYHLCFASRAEREYLSTVLRDKGTNAVSARLGIRQGPGGGLRSAMAFCPECIRVDQRTVGHGYWRVAHQLPFVTLCHEHEARLIIGCRHCGVLVPTKHTFRLPVLGGCCEEFEPCYRPQILKAEIELWVAKATHAALDLSRSVRSNWIASSGREALLASGYGRASGLDLGRIAAELLLRFGEDALGLLTIGSTKVASDVTWMRRELAVGTKRPHTLRTLVLLSLADDWRTYYQTKIPTAGPKDAHDWRKSVGRLFHEHRGSITAVAKALGRSWTAVRSEAAAQRLPIAKKRNANIERLGEEAWKRIEQLLAQGRSYTDIRGEFAVENHTLTRLVKDMPDIGALRERALQERSQKSVEDKRSAVRAALHANPSLSRKQIQRVVGYAYDHLLRVDREWLESVLPPPDDLSDRAINLAKEHERRRNAAILDDIKMAAKVKAYAGELRANESPPQKISKCRLLEHVGYLTKSYRSPHLMPLTASAAEEESETGPMFHRRRLRWSLVQLAERKTYTNLSEVVRTSGLGSAEVRKHAAWVEQVADELGLTFAPITAAGRDEGRPPFR